MTGSKPNASFTPHVPSATASGQAQESGDAVTLLSVAEFVARYSRFVALTALACAAAAFLLTLIRGPVYTAESRFVPQISSSSTSRLAGLAAQFGIDVGAAGGQSPSELYASLVQSRGILERVAVTSYPTSTDTGPSAPHQTLIELMKLKAPDTEQLHLDAVENLRKRISVSTDVRTGVITLQSTTPWREVSEALNRRIIELVTEFNQTRRQSQARAEREFLEARSREAQQQLRDAEARLASFNDQNRVRGSSQLVLEGARLQRAVDLAQQVFVTLAANYEQARIEEVRNTPVITVIDAPEGSAKRQRGLVKKTAIGLVLGAIFGIGIALVTEQLRRRRALHPAEFAQVAERLRASFRPWARESRN